MTGMRTVLLAFTLLGVLVPAARTTIAGAAAVGSLSVTTTPSAAQVYIDGRLAGVTPFLRQDLAAGDHRVRVSKEGFLDNARVVRIVRGRPVSLDISLTRATPGAATSLAAPGGGGGMKKWLIVGAAAGGATAAALTMRETNKAPSAGTVTAAPATAYVGESVQLSVSGDSDPDGDPLTYAWEFGDGGTGTGKSVSHAYNSAGSFTATVTVSDGKKSATASGSVTIKANSAPNAGSVTVSAATALAGTNVTFSSVGASDADNDPLTYNWAFSDGTTATGTSVTKTFSSAGTFTATLTVRDGRASATATGGVTIRTLSGTWTGGLTGIKTVMTLNHSGGSISGSFTFDIGFAGTVSGSINPTTRVVTLTVSVPSFQAFTFTGNPSADFNTLSGVANGSGFVNDTWNMTR